MAVKETVVSPDVIRDDVNELVQTNNSRVILVPMAEWKQSAQRGVRTFFQAFIFTAGGGSVVGYLTNLGIPPASVANLPSTGNALFDAVCYSAVFGLVVFVWNFAEFWLDIDIKAPKWRALGTVATAVAGAYAVVRKSKNETTQTATTTAQTTVQASLEAMKTVVESLRDEIGNKQAEIDELRTDLADVRKTNILLEQSNVQQGLQIERLTGVAKVLKRRVEVLERASGKTPEQIDFDVLEGEGI